MERRDGLVEGADLEPLLERLVVERRDVLGRERRGLVEDVEAEGEGPIGRQAEHDPELLGGDGLERTSLRLELLGARDLRLEAQHVGLRDEPGVERVLRVDDVRGRRLDRLMGDDGLADAVHPVEEGDLPVDPGGEHLGIGRKAPGARAVRRRRIPLGEPEQVIRDRHVDAAGDRVLVLHERDRELIDDHGLALLIEDAVARRAPRAGSDRRERGRRRGVARREQAAREGVVHVREVHRLRGEGHLREERDEGLIDVPLRLLELGEPLADAGARDHRGLRRVVGRETTLDGPKRLGQRVDLGVGLHPALARRRGLRDGGLRRGRRNRRGLRRGDAR